MSNDLVALIRERRSIEKVAVNIRGLYNTASTALANRGINPMGTMGGAAIGTVTGAIKGYKNADEDNKVGGAILGGIAGGAGGALLGNTLHQSAKNLKGIRGELKATKQGMADAYKAKHEMGFLDRLKSRFSKDGRQQLSQANQRFASDKEAKKNLLQQHKQQLSDTKMKIQSNPNLSYDQQIDEVNKLYASNPMGRRELAVDKLKGAALGPLAATMTAGALNTAGTSAFAKNDPMMTAQILEAKKKGSLSEQERFILNEKLNQIQASQGNPPQEQVAQQYAQQPSGQMSSSAM